MLAARGCCPRVLLVGAARGCCSRLPNASQNRNVFTFCMKMCFALAVLLSVEQCLSHWGGGQAHDKHNEKDHFCLVQGTENWHKDFKHWLVPRPCFTSVTLAKVIAVLATIPFAGFTPRLNKCLTGGIRLLINPHPILLPLRQTEISLYSFTPEGTQVQYVVLIHSDTW